MINSKHTVSLDEVLADYAHAVHEFDANRLQTFIERYPEYALDLQRYAFIQLTSLPATQTEIDEELLKDEEMLPVQSKLLQRMQQIRDSSLSSDAAEAAVKLASLSGELAMRKAAIVVFGSCEHGEDLLLLCVVDPNSVISGVPAWFYRKFGDYIGVTSTALIAGMEMKRQQTLGAQRFSSKGKPRTPSTIAWEQIVGDCITDDVVKEHLLQHS